MNKVTVQVYGTDDVPSASAEDFVATSHAQHGFPVTIRIRRDNQTQVLHLSMAEAMQLQKGIAAARAGIPCGNMREFDKL